MSNNIGTTLDGKFCQGSHTIATTGGNASNVDGDFATIPGLCTAVNGIDFTATITVQLKSSQVSVTIPAADVRGHKVHALPQVGDQTISTGVITTVVGTGPTATLTVLLTNSQQTITVSAYDVVASQSL